MNEVIEELEAWRKERNIVDVDLEIVANLKDEVREAREALEKNDIENYVEEVSDVGIFIFNWIGCLKLDFIRNNKHPFDIIDINSLDSMIDSINLFHSISAYIKMLMIIDLCNDLVKKEGYDFRSVLLEKIKVLNSREQDPTQKEDWLKNGPKGKWQKNKNQNPDTLYKADFSKCKL